MSTYFLVLWFVICPIENHPIEIERISYVEVTCETRNLEECPKHHIALFLRPKRITKIEKVIDKEKSTEAYLVSKELKTEIQCSR